MTAIETLAAQQAETATARSRLYRLLADGFLFPDETFFAAVKAGRYRDQIADAARRLPYELDFALDGLVAAGRYLDFQAEYLRLFEVGLGMPPCPLYSGLYRGGRKAVMEELTRFYNYFGLSVEAGQGELPDHLATELEFMHFLTFKEAATLVCGDDAGSYRRAQADFLERQLNCWLPMLDRRLAGLDAPPFYVALVWLTNAVTQGDGARVRSRGEAAP